MKWSYRQVLALGISLASSNQKPSNRFPDFLAPFRGIFGGSRPPNPNGPNGPPHNKNNLRESLERPNYRDQSGAETKPYEDSENDFRPSTYFPENSQKFFSSTPRYHGEKIRPGRQAHGQDFKFTENRPHAYNNFPNSSPRPAPGFSDFNFSPPDFSQNYETQSSEPQIENINNIKSPHFHRPQEYREEPQIITLADLQNSPQQFSHAPQRPNFSPNHGPIYQSQPMRPMSSSFRPPPNFNHFESPSEEETTPYSANFNKNKRKRHNEGMRHLRPNQNFDGGRENFKLSNNEEVHYGKPMIMSASTSPRTVVKVKKLKEENSESPVLLHSPKLKTSASVESPVYEPQTAETGHGHGHGDIGGIESNGDRILYHVAGHEGPYSYRFGYDTGKGYNRMFRHEQKDGKGYVTGKYGFYDKDGKLNVVNYQAHPEKGFHAERGH